MKKNKEEKRERILIKISGEALKSAKQPLSGKKLDFITDVIKNLYFDGYQIVIICGAGNISRGTFGRKWNIAPADADVNGMLATIVNIGWLTSVSQQKIGKANVRKLITIPSSYCGESYSMEKAKSYLGKGKVVLIGGGTGNALCTTDTAAVQRAVELDVNRVIMLKNGADGVYTDDPNKNPEAKKYKKISFEDFKGNGIIDEIATVNAFRYKMPMHFIAFEEANRIGTICRENIDLGTFVGDVPTEFY